MHCVAFWLLQNEIPNLSVCVVCTVNSLEWSFILSQKKTKYAELDRVKILNFFSANMM